MTIVETRFTSDVASMLQGLDQIDARINRMEMGAQRLQGTFDRAFSFATLATGVGIMVAGTERLVQNLDQVIARFNVLQGLDRAGLFFNTSRQVESLMRGLGDIGVRSEAQSQVARLMSAETPLDLRQIEMMGQVARGFMLGGETRSIQEGLHAQELYWTGGQSRMLHRLGIGVDTAYGYRQYAQQHGMRLADMSGEDRMQARVDEFFRAASAYNTAGFGADTGSTSLQQIQAFASNTRDSYVRSLAGGIEMLAKSLGDIQRLDPNRIGEVLATVQPLAIGGGVIASTGMAFGSRIAPLQMQMPHLRGQLDVASVKLSLAQENASAANLREQAAREAYRVSRLRDSWVRGEDDVILPLEQTSRYQNNQAEILRHQRNVELYKSDEAAHGLAGAVARERDIQNSYQRAIARGNQLGAIGPSGELLDFEQTGAGASAMRGARGARVAAETAAASQRALQAEVEAANRSIASQNRMMATFIGFEAGIALVTAAWTAYSNAVQGAERAQLDFLTKSKGIGEGAADVVNMQQAGATPQMIRAELERGGMDQAGINTVLAQISRGGSQDDIAKAYARAVTEQGRDQWIGAESRGIAADSWLKMAASLLPGGGGITGFGAGIAGVLGSRDRASGLYDKWIGGSISTAPADLQRALELQRKVEEIEADAKFEQLQGRIADTQAMGGRFTQAAGGFSPRTSYAEQYQRQVDRMILGFDPSKLRGAELGRYEGLRDDAISREIARDKEEEQRRIRAGIEAYDKESRARLQVASLQDQALGAGAKLLAETNTEAAQRANASQLISVYENALQEGNTALVAEIEARGDLRGAIRRQAVASLNLTRQMEETVSSLRQQIPGMYGGAAADIQAQIGAQTSIEQGLYSNNPFMSRFMSIRGQALSLMPQIGQYEQQQALVEAMTAVSKGQDAGSVLTRFGLPDGLSSFLLDFGKKDAFAQSQAIASQRAANWQLQRQLVTGLGGFGGDLLSFRNSLNPPGGLDQQYRGAVNEFYRSGLIEDFAPDIGALLGYGEGEGLLNPASVGKVRGAFGGKLPTGDVNSMVARAKTGVDAVVDQQAVLVLSLKDLQASVDRLTTTLGGTPPTASPGQTSGEGWGATVGAAAAGGFVGSLGLPPRPSDALPDDIKAHRGSATTGFIPDEAPSGFTPARNSDDLFMGIPPSPGAMPEVDPAVGNVAAHDVGAILFASISNRGRDVLTDARRGRNAEVARNVWGFTRGRGRRLYGRVPTYGGDGASAAPWSGNATSWGDSPPYYPAQADYYGYGAGTNGIDTGFGTQYYYQEYGGTGLGGGGG